MRASNKLSGLIRALIFLLSIGLSFIIIVVIGSEHAVRAQRAAGGQSGVGTGILISYLISWPGIAVFTALFADAVYLEGRLTARPLAGALGYGAIPICLNFVFLFFSGKLPYPANQYTLLTGILAGFVAPFVVLGLGFWSKRSTPRL